MAKTKYSHREPRFAKTTFIAVATSGEVKSYSALATCFGIDKATAERFCKKQGIVPSFIQKQVQQ